MRAFALAISLVNCDLGFSQETEPESRESAPAPIEPIEKLPEPAPLSKETGLAAFYHATFQGRRTANGETFDHNGLTAAHKSLPFGTLVRVINLRNNRSVVVRINDRGPFHADRVIDLTRKAAEILGFLYQGMTRVAVEILPPAAPAPPRK